MRRSEVIPAESGQLVLARVEDWQDRTAELARFERTENGGWREVGTPWPAVVGIDGSGWGRGLHGQGAPAGRSGPVKREGDGRSPAGAFALGASFGYSDKPPAGARTAYTQVDTTWFCVDDPGSAHYNALVDADDVAADWASAETMRRADDLYRWGIVVEHNDGRVPGAGSCIFLHVWDGPASGTAGCTAVESAAVEALLRWLEPAARPVFVLLPDPEIAALRAAWGLP